MRDAYAAQRGQALFETALALPLVLLTLFGIIFFDRLGVISERSQRAVRYGAEVVPPPTYLPQMYEALYKALTTSGGQLASTSTSGCDPLIVPQVQLAVTNDESQPTTLTGAQAFWRPDGSPVASCNAATVHVPNASQFNEVFTLGISQALDVSVMSPVVAPGYISALFPSAASPNATDFALSPVTPTIVLSCTPKMTDPVSEVLWPSFSPYRTSNSTVSAFYGQPTANSDAHADVVC